MIGFSEDGMLMMSCSPNRQPEDPPVRKNNRVEITCTAKQKEKIIEALLCPDGCLWPRKQAHCAYDPLADCRTCFEKKIKWNITNKKGAK